MPLSGDGTKSVFQYLFNENMIPDVDHAALFFTFLATVLQSMFNVICTAIELKVTIY